MAGLGLIVSLILLVTAPQFLRAQERSTAHPVAIPAPGIYPGAVHLDPAILDGSFLFRFAPTSPWRPFDRVLVLDAFPGEQRQYRLELLFNPTGAVSRFDYTIDRKPPEAPVLFPPPGDVGATLELGLKGEGSLMLSLDGQAFAPYKPSETRLFHAPSDGSLIVSAAAYALDPQGNTSLPAYARWRLSRLDPENLPPFSGEMGIQSGLLIKDKPEGVTIRTAVEPGSNPRVILDVPGGMTPVLAISSIAEGLSEASFIRLPSSAGRASAEIPVPWGYDLELALRFGYESSEGLIIAGDTRAVRAEFPFKGPPVPPQKAPEPLVSYLGGAALLSWPPSTIQLYFSLDGSDFVRYREPVLLPYRGSVPYRLSYQAANDGGRSQPLSISIQVLPGLEAPSIGGVTPGRTYGTAPPVQVSAPYGSVRYEMTMDGSDPPPPNSTSPAIAEAPLFAGLDGQVVLYRLRVAAVDNKGQVGPERYISFAVDREAPPIPVLSRLLPPYSSKDLTLALESSGADTLIYYSADQDGSGKFQEYREPVVLPGSEDGRKQYIIRAFAEDAFGNRSPEMKNLTVVVDRSSLYVDPSGKVGATGTPDDPLQTLQEALKISATSGRRIIHIRGNHVLGGPIKVDGNLRLLGGYSSDWKENQRERAGIRFTQPLASGSAGVRVQGGTLELRSLSLHSEGTGVTVLIDAQDARLLLAQVTLTMSGGLEATVLRLGSSLLSTDGVEVSIRSVVTGRALDALDSESVLERLVVSADSSVRLFDALRITGGQARLQDLRLEASPGLAFSGITLNRTQVSMSGSAFLVRGGASTLRLLHLNAASLVADTLFGDIVWLGEAELCRLGSSSTLRLAHATVLAKAKRINVVESRSSTWSVFNSIVHVDSGLAIFASTDRAPEQGAISANCLWGFTSFLSIGGIETTGLIGDLNRYSTLGFANFIEPPSKTFATSSKGVPLLSASSACIGAAAPLPWVVPAELKQNLRAPNSRDIGVDGLREGRL